MSVKQSIHVLCALGLFCAAAGQAMADPPGSKTGKVFPTVTAGQPRDGHEPSGEVRRPYGVVTMHQGSEESVGTFKWCWSHGRRYPCH
jgi:hypothetical protein